MMNTQNLWPGFLETVLSSDDRHYLWLRSLSYLEYIGYRKMVKSVPYSKVNRGVYKHLSDEIEHSFILRESAEKSFPRKSIPKALDEGLIRIAEDYFQGIDSKIHDYVKEKTGEANPFLAYMAVSYVIEKRAMRVYPTYFAALTSPPLKGVIQKIVKEESEHLSYLEGVMEALTEGPALRDPFLFEMEERLFSRYLQAMDRFLQTARS